MDAKLIWRWDFCSSTCGYASGIDDVVLSEIEQGAAQGCEARGSKDGYSEPLEPCGGHHGGCGSTMIEARIE